MKSWMKIGMAGFAALILAGSAAAQDELKGPEGMTEPAAQGAEAPKQGQPTPEQMEAWKQYATPGEEHKVLNAFVGTWKASSTCRMTPDAEPVKSEGTSEIRWIMGGRFLEQTFQGDMMGQPFEGRGIIGYDNYRKEYTGLWIDNMGTGIIRSAGQYDAVGKVINENATCYCPMKGEEISYRSEWRSIDEKHFTFSMYMPDKDGNEFKSMEMLYEKQEPAAAPAEQK